MRDPNPTAKVLKSQTLIDVSKGVVISNDQCYAARLSENVSFFVVNNYTPDRLVDLGVNMYDY